VDRLDRLRLVGVQPLDAAGFKPRPKAGMEPRRPLPVLRRPGREMTVVNNASSERGLLEQAGEDGLRAGGKSL